MIACQAEDLDRLQEIGFDPQHIEARGRKPDASFDGNRIDFALALPLPHCRRGVLAFLKPDLPGRLSPDAGQTFALIAELASDYRLQYRNAEIVQTGGRQRCRKTGAAPGGLPVLVQEKG